jgi:cholesterol oxidase
MSPLDCDLLVVGSGFGGSVCALRGVEAGLRVVVLERGRRMDAAAFDDLADGRINLFHRRNAPGLIELHTRRSLMAATGSGVGGGSHLYTGVTVPAPPEAFAADWPDGMTFERMAPYFARVARVIRPSAIPRPMERTVALETIGRRLGAEVTRLPVAMDWPDDTNGMTRPPPPNGLRRHVVTLLQGGPSVRKRTLDKTYLCRAEELGADVRPLCEVQTVTPEGDGYRVHYRRADPEDGLDGSIYARRVVIAAGALNTVRLLLKLRDVSRALPRLSKALGTRFFTNGDFGALLLGPKAAPGEDSGPPVTAWIDLWKQDRMYLMETGLLPIGLGVVNFSKRLGRAWSFGVMGLDNHRGRLRLDRRGALVHEFEAGSGEVFDHRRRDRLRELAAAAGGLLLMSPAWMTRRTAVTIHPIGGARMAESPDEGVTDPFGEVFGYPGLFIADAGVLPAPTGVAPSMTIAAVAEFVIEQMVRRC